MHCVAQLQRVSPAGRLDKALPEQGQHLTRLRLCRRRLPHPGPGKDGNDRGDCEMFSHCRTRTAASTRS